MTRAIIAIAILALLNFYLVWRVVARWPWAAQHIGATLLVAIVFFAVQLLGPCGDRLFFPNWRENDGLTRLVFILDWIAYAALGILTCAFVYMIALDIVTLTWQLIAPSPDPIRFDRRALLTLGGVTLGTAALGIGQAVAGPTVREVDIPLKNLPPAFDGFKIAQISDLHVGPTIGLAYTQNVVNIANGLKPDMFALTGDFIDGAVDELLPELAPIATLQAPHGSFFVTGNHEYYWDAAAWTKAFTGLGARVLSNEHTVLKRGNAQLLLAGVTDYSTLRMPSDHASSPQRALDGAPDGLVKILLAHQPASYQMASDAGFDLQLSGHTHAGQYFPFSLFIGFFQKYYKGLNRHENMWVYVNSGTGYWGPPLRTGVPSEITLITLRTA